MQRLLEDLVTTNFLFGVAAKNDERITRVGGTGVEVDIKELCPWTEVVDQLPQDASRALPGVAGGILVKLGMNRRRRLERKPMRGPNAVSLNNSGNEAAVLPDLILDSNVTPLNGAVFE